MEKGKQTKREKREEVEIAARVHVGEQTASAIASFPTSFPGVTPGSGKRGRMVGRERRRAEC